MALFIRLTVAMIVTSFLLVGCGKTQAADADQTEHSQESADAHDESDDEHASHEDGEDDHDDEDEAGLVVLTDAELEEFDIEIDTAGSQPIAMTTNLPGEVVMNPDAVAHVVARASGIAREVFKTVGDTVSAGDSLAILESPALAEAKAEYLSRLREHELAQTDLVRVETVHRNTRKLLEFLSDTPILEALQEFSDLDLGANRTVLVSGYAQLVAAQASYDREKSLYEKQIGSKAEYLEAQSAFKQAQASYLSVRDDLTFSNSRTLDQARRMTKVAEIALLATERKLHALGLSEAEVASVPQQTDMELARYEIEVPIDGVIIERHIVRGELLEQGSNVFTVADLSTVWVNLTVYQKDLTVMRPGLTVEIVARHGIGRIRGTIQYVSPVISESTRTTTARVVLENPDGAWRPGLFVTGRVQTGTFEASVVVPKTAIHTIEENLVIFVRDEHGFEPRVVQLGQKNDTHVEITSGLAPGEEYVSVGGFALKAELNKSSFEHAGHGH